MLEYTISITIRTTVQSPSWLYSRLWFLALHLRGEERRKQIEGKHCWYNFWLNSIQVIVFGARFTYVRWSWSASTLFLLSLHFALCFCCCLFDVSFRGLYCFLPSHLFVYFRCFVRFGSPRFGSKFRGFRFVCCKYENQKKLLQKCEKNTFHKMHTKANCLWTLASL